MASILLAVTGSIAAYKAADLASKLTQDGHHVTVAMTAAAQRLVTANTFLNLTGNPVYTDLWDPEQQTKHIAVTDAAELIVVAPATANTIAKAALGLADDPVSTTLLAAGCPVLLCPAMNPRMWSNPLVQGHLERLRALGHTVMLPDEGRMACGHTGPGRMPEPGDIVAKVDELLNQKPPAKRLGVFLELLTLEELPEDAVLAKERAYRAAAQERGALEASGPLGPKRFAYVHRAPSLEAALQIARSSPLGKTRCNLQVFPWRLG